MSEREFEAWLSLLGGLLKLSPQQRQDISEELRTHLEDRLEDLTASGLSRDDAIAAALEEFGDAAGLASHFTHIAHLRNRRRLMRWTYGTIAATTCAILTLAAFWPNNQANGPLTPSEVAAQDETASAPGSGDFASGEFEAEFEFEKSQVAPQATADPFAGSRERIEAKLSQPYEGPQFLGLPLRDVLNQISDELDVDLLIDGRIDGEIELNEPVDFAVTKGRMSARTMLQTILRDAFDDQFSYVIRDEVIFITNKNSATEIQTYNVSDLVAANGSPSARGQRSSPGAGQEDLYGEYGELDYGSEYMSGESYGMESSGYPGAMPSGFGSGYPGQSSTGSRRTAGANGASLVEVIQHTIQPGNWVTSPSDDAPTIEYFNGLLIIKHTQETHRDVKQLLEQMRSSLRERGESSPSVPRMDGYGPNYAPAGSPYGSGEIRRH